MRVELGAPLSKALGDRTAKALASALDLHTVGDLLHHYPRRYAERGTLTPLRDLLEGEHVTVLAEVRSSSVRRTSTGKALGEVVVTDGTGTLRLTFFGRATWRVKDLAVGRRGLFAGQVTVFNRAKQLSHPDFQLVDGAGDDSAGDGAEAFSGALLPVYPAAKALPSWNVAKAVRLVLDLADVGPDPLPEPLRTRLGLPGLAAALRDVHQPAGWPDVRRAQTRLKWDEALVLQVVLAQRRAAALALPGTARPGRAEGLRDAFEAALPFVLTTGQREVGERLGAELAQAQPMHRLLQGEVGSGKTIVALRAMLAVVDSGGQAALLAPTEVLAQQHARSLRALLGPLATAGELGAADVATRVALLTGSLPAAARRRALAEAADGSAGIVVGTHALLSEGVEFADLGLVVVDEQHRFGVEQRDALRAKGTSPHLLVMTATQIPRTVAMTVYGDLEVSTLTELPAGRSPISTAVVPVAEHPAWLDRAWQRVREAAQEGRQSFVVCPRIGDAEEPAEPGEDGRRPAVAVAELLPLLVAGPLAGLRVAALHGAMASAAKDEVLGRFATGALDVLVATTVVEVGVDVPGAVVMVVMDADRFGVSQLHQLRGRIGRGAHPGLCLLVTEAELDTAARARVDAVASTTDGFALSQLDLEQRREGDVLGATQSGRRSSLRMLQLLRDTDVIVAAREEAVRIVAEDPDLTRTPGLAAAVDALVDEQRAGFLEKA